MTNNSFNLLLFSIPFVLFQTITLGGFYLGKYRWLVAANNGHFLVCEENLGNREINIKASKLFKARQEHISV